MTDKRPPKESPWATAKPLSTERKLDKRERAAVRPSYAPPPSRPITHSAAPSSEHSERHNTNSRHEEVRFFGRNACHAVFAHRPGDIRKVYLTEARIPEFKSALAFCVQNKLGYRVVETADLDKLTQTQHHEGICFDLRRTTPMALDDLLAAMPAAPAPALLMQLDGVGNPHNFGAMLRSAAHFGIDGVVLPPDSALGLSGAAARVAEGGAEAVTIAQPRVGEDALARLRSAGFTIAATVPRGGVSLYATTLPARLALIFGAEGEGMREPLIAAADLRLNIPGSGSVESLNISASAAVLFGEYFRQHRC